MSPAERLRLIRLANLLERESLRLEREGDVDGAFRCVEAMGAVDDRLDCTRNGVVQAAYEQSLRDNAELFSLLGA